MAATLDCYQFRIMPEIGFKLFRAARGRCCAVRLEFEQTPFSQRPMNDRKIEWSNESCFGWYYFVTSSIEIPFSNSNKIRRHGPKLTKRLLFVVTRITTTIREQHLRPTHQSAAVVHTQRAVRWGLNWQLTVSHSMPFANLAIHPLQSKPFQLSN